MTFPFYFVTVDVMWRGCEDVMVFFRSFCDLTLWLLLCEVTMWLQCGKFDICDSTSSRVNRYCLNPFRIVRVDFFATGLWRLCIQSGDQILPKSSPISSDRLFLLQVYGICDECASGRLTKFHSSPILKIRIAFFSTGLWRFWIGLCDKVLPKSIRKFRIAFF